MPPARAGMLAGGDSGRTPNSASNSSTGRGTGELNAAQPFQAVRVEKSNCFESALGKGGFHPAWSKFGRCMWSPQELLLLLLLGARAQQDVGMILPQRAMPWLSPRSPAVTAARGSKLSLQWGLSHAEL